MEKQFFFTAKQFDRFFPFHFIMNEDQEITNIGSSLNKLLPDILNKKFSNVFDVKRPNIKLFSFKSIKHYGKHVFIFYSREQPDIVFRGEFELLENYNSLLFLGTPWFKSIEQVQQKGLGLNDFAIHDNFSDLMHVIKSLEIAHSDSVQLLNTVIAQKNAIKESELELKETSLRLTQIIENIEGGILVENENREIVLINQKFCDIFSINLPPETLIGMDCSQSAENTKTLFKFPDIFVQRINIILRNKEKILGEKLELTDGRFFNRDYIPVFHGRVYQGHLWKYTDITESVVVEKRLQEQRQFYEQILNEIPADIAVFDKDMRYLFVNPFAVHNPGTRSWLIGKTDKEYCDYRNRTYTFAIERERVFKKVIEQGYQYEWEEQSMDAHGETNYHLRKMYPVFNDEGQLDIMIGYGVDITERKKIEEQVKLSESKFREIFDFSQALICTHDLDGHLLSVNNAIINTLEYTEKELLGKYVYSVLPKSKIEEFGKAYIQEILKNKRSEGIMIGVTKSGKKVHLLYQNYLVQDPGTEPYIIGFAQDVTERVNAENALRKSEEKYRNIIRNMNLGLMEVDLDEYIIYVNQSFCDMCGFTEEELVGKNAKELFVKGENIKVIEGKSELRKNNISDAYEIAVKTKRGDLRWWLISGAPRIGDDGMLKGSIGIHLDITHQKRLEQELRKAKSEAEYSAHAKEIFLANMSHEIRTPMNAIMGMGRLLKKSTLENQQMFYVDAIQNASENLLVIINDILDFSKIEAGKVTIENIGFKLHQILDQALVVMKHKAEEKDLLLNYHIDDQVASVLIGDPFRINQVILNMLSNSIKFTEKGSVKINCHYLRGDEFYQHLRIDIEDTGIGMSHEFLSHLFEKFTQEDESVTRKFGGTGLGMSISKQLIELMGGRIEVKSEKGVGTTISIYLKMNVGEQKDIPQKDEKNADTRSLKSKRILLVEDNAMNRLVASVVLKDFGAVIDEAEDGEKAIEKLREDHYDLILMDLQMPVKDGLETTQYIREYLDKTIPIIALTANAIKGEAERCLSAGMNDFISKPFDEEKLIQIVAKWIGDENAQKVDIELLKGTDTEVLYDLTKLKAISRGNNDFVDKMVSLFMEEIPVSMNSMLEAFNNYDYPKIQAIAHRLKPSIHNMGIESVALGLGRLELLAKEAEPNKDYTELDALVINSAKQLKLVIEQLKQRKEMGEDW